MFKFFSTLLDKMGNWFGIIFKIILPALVMYRPIKMVSLSILVFGSALGGNVASLNNFGILVFFLLYGIFVVMLFLFPKVASAMEFVMIIYYFGCLFAFGFLDFFTLRVQGIDSVMLTYAKMAPVVLIFLAGKILFFFFIRFNRDKIEQGRHEKFGFFDITM